MLFFSTILNARVHDKDDEVMGGLVDVLVEMKKDRTFTPLRGILLKNKKSGQEVFVDSAYIATWSRDGVSLKTKLDEAVSPVPDQQEVLFLKKNVLDKQIVDLAGVRVVRVNDLQFGIVQGRICLLAIDVSASGLLRRLGFKRPLRPHLLEWTDVHLIGDKLQLAIGKDKLIKLHPADIANIVEKLNLRQGSQLLRSLDETMAAKVMEEIKPEIQKLLVQHLGLDRAVDIMSKMSTDELVDLIQLLPTSESKRLINELPLNKDINSVKKILEYDEDTAGGLMTTEYITTHPESTVKETIEQVKQVSDVHRSIYFIYVTDKDGRFLGVVSMRRLLVAREAQKISEVMKRIKRVPAVTPDKGLTYVASIMTKYNLLSVAVVDRENKMLGVVTIDDIMRCFVPKA